MVSSTMSRSWWMKGALFALLLVAAVILLVPSVVPYEHQPEFIRRHFHPLRVGTEPGLHLVYEVDLDKAISLRMDSAAKGLEQILRNEHPKLSIKVERQGSTDIVLSSPQLGPELSYQNLRKAGDGWITEHERDERTGAIRLRFDGGKTAEVREIAIRSAMEAIVSYMDQGSEECLTRDGDRIRVDLPGMRRADADRVKHIIGFATSRPVQLKFVIVENDPDYMHKIAAAIPPDSGIELVTELPAPR